MLKYIPMLTAPDRDVSRGAPCSAPLRVAHRRALSVLALVALAGCGGSSGSTPLEGQGEGTPVLTVPDTTAPNTTGAATGGTPVAAGGQTPAADSPEGSTPESPSAAAATAAAAAPEPGLYAGTYHVPVPPELEAYADFELEAVRLELRGSELVLQYDLPALLLGEAQGVSFRGAAASDGSYTLQGDSGTATCRASDASWTCDEVLQGIELDSDKMDRELASMSAEEAIGRRSVAARFASDPIGVLHIHSSP
jgi:hypothetical protein